MYYVSKIKKKSLKLKKKILFLLLSVLRLVCGFTPSVSIVLFYMFQYPFNTNRVFDSSSSF